MLAKSFSDNKYHYWCEVTEYLEVKSHEYFMRLLFHNGDRHHFVQKCKRNGNCACIEAANQHHTLLVWSGLVFSIFFSLGSFYSPLISPFTQLGVVILISGSHSHQWVK